MSTELVDTAIILETRSVSLTELLRAWHRAGRLVPMLKEAAADEVVRARGEELGLEVGDAELQRAADDFRRRNGLESAEQTHAWLEDQRLSVADFEAMLEDEILFGKVRDEVTRKEVPRHFAASRSDYDRVRLSQIVVPREDLARELLMQIHEEGADFAELAGRHSLHPSRTNGGSVGVVYRSQLPAEAAGAVFEAEPGEVVGPLSTSHGFALYLVTERWPAELDEVTSIWIRDRLFDKWLNAQIGDSSVTFPLLDML